MPESETATTTSCTCGHCYGGWLSPRMKERLEYSAELRYELSKSLLETQDGVPSDVSSVLPIDYAHIDHAVHYLPPTVRAKIGPSGTPASVGSGSGAATATALATPRDAVYRGYVAVFKAIKDLLDADEAAGGFPTVATISARLDKLRHAATSTSASDKPQSESGAAAAVHAAVAAYLDGGGEAAHALDCIVDRAREELSPLGRHYDEEKQYIDAILDGEEQHGECANDLDFGLVRARLGLPSETLGVVLEGEEGDWSDPPSDDEAE